MSTTVFAALGPNPAPLTELIWALRRQRSLATVEVFLVVDPRGHDYLHKEILGAEGALAELCQALQLELDGAKLHERIVEPPSGAGLDDEDPVYADLYNTATWEQARVATEHAGDGPTVFALAAGRRRTMTAMSTMAFQLLARKQDLCVDVRVRDKRAEGATGFYFPDQSAQELLSRQGEPFIAREVEVHLIDVHVPRLRGLVPTAALASYGSALAAGQQAIDVAAPPRLVIDLVDGQALAGEHPLPLSYAQLIWLTALAHARIDGSAEGWIAGNDTAAVDHVVAAAKKRPWSDAVKAKPLRWLLGDKTAYRKKKDPTVELIEDLRKLRSDARKHLYAWCNKHHPSWTGHLVPQIDQRWVDGGLTFFQRLPLEPDRVMIHGIGPP